MSYPMLPRKLIEAGGMYVIKKPEGDSYYDNPDQWLPVVVLDTDVRMTFSSVTGIAVAIGNRPFLPRGNFYLSNGRGAYGPVNHKDGPVTWTHRIISHRYFRALYKDWAADMRPVQADRRAAYQQQQKDQKARRRQLDAENKKARREAVKRQQASMTPKARKEAAAAEKRRQKMIDGAKARYDQARKDAPENEKQLRKVLASFGINDSDGWRGVTSKARYSTQDDTSIQVYSTYVRHLDLSDVLVLTGGRTEPESKTRAKAKA